MDARVKTFLDLLFKWNAVHHLTAFESESEAMARGILPSLAVLDDIPLGAEVLDVGSGGGFPAVVLAIERPDLRLTLSEPSLSKVAFLREATLVLGVKYEVAAQPVEMVLKTKPAWDVITVRGVHLRHGLIKRLSGALRPGGLLAIWSGGEREREYAKWLGERGLRVDRRDLGTGEPLILLTARVPS